MHHSTRVWSATFLPKITCNWPQQIHLSLGFNTLSYKESLSPLAKRITLDTISLCLSTSLNKAKYWLTGINFSVEKIVLHSN